MKSYVGIQNRSRDEAFRAIAIIEIVYHDNLAVLSAGPVSQTLDYAPATEADLEETARAVVALGRRWMACRLDQRDFGGLRDAAARIEREFGRIDILFANAGVQAFKPILDMDDADWHDQIDVNLTGTANAIRAFGPAMVRRGGDA